MQCILSIPPIIVKDMSMNGKCALSGINQGWHIGLPIYRHFLKYRLSVSVKVRTDKISAIGYRLWQNTDISEYQLSVSVKSGTDKISLIGNRLWSNISNRLSAKFNRYAIPGINQV